MGSIGRPLAARSVGSPTGSPSTASPSVSTITGGRWRKSRPAASRLTPLFDGAGASPLLWQADVAWLIVGKADPSALMARFSDRLAAIHMKDIAPEGTHQDEDGWCDLGDGTIDWPPLIAEARGHGVELFVAEHDEPKDPAGFSAAARTTLAGWLA